MDFLSRDVMTSLPPITVSLSFPNRDYMSLSFSQGPNVLLSYFDSETCETSVSARIIEEMNFLLSFTWVRKSKYVSKYILMPEIEF